MGNGHSHCDQKSRHHTGHERARRADQAPEDQQAAENVYDDFLSYEEQLPPYTASWGISTSELFDRQHMYNLRCACEANNKIKRRNAFRWRTATLAQMQTGDIPIETMYDQQTGDAIPRFPATMRDIGQLSDACARRIIGALSRGHMIPEKATVEDLRGLIHRSVVDLTAQQDSDRRDGEVRRERAWPSSSQLL